MSFSIREHLRFKLFDARKHDLPMPDNDCNDPHDMDIEEHLTQEMDKLSEWLVDKYWDEHT